MKSILTGRYVGIPEQVSGAILQTIFRALHVGYNSQLVKIHQQRHDLASTLTYQVKADALHTSNLATDYLYTFNIDTISHANNPDLVGFPQYEYTEVSGFTEKARRYFNRPILSATFRDSKVVGNMNLDGTAFAHVLPTIINRLRYHVLPALISSMGNISVSDTVSDNLIEADLLYYTEAGRPGTFAMLIDTLVETRVSGLITHMLYQVIWDNNNDLDPIQDVQLVSSPFTDTHFEYRGKMPIELVTERYVCDGELAYRSYVQVDSETSDRATKTQARIIRAILKQKQALIDEEAHLEQLRRLAQPAIV